MVLAGVGSATGIPLRPGGPATLATLREGLIGAGYTEAGVGARLGIANAYAFQSPWEGRAPLEPSDPLSLLIHLFLDGQVCARALLERTLSPALVAALDELGLLRPVPGDEGRCLATVLLYPTEGLYIASDRDYDPTAAGDAHLVVGADSVYPATTPNTGDFLSALPQTPCDRVLDLGSGTGIAALVQSRVAGHAWALDITERATEFARFNIALNGIANVTALVSDLYAAVAGQTFDRIVAHPPYLPALHDEFIYRDAGVDGEQVTRRILEGLPAHLTVGGTFHCTCMATDRTGAPLQERIRGLLGSAASEFDIVVAPLRVMTPQEHYAADLERGKSSRQKVEAQIAALERLGVEHMVLGTILLKRHGEARAGITARRMRGPQTGYAALEWLRRWQVAASRADALEATIAGARPRLSPVTLLRSVSRVVSDAWQPEEMKVEVPAPFPVTMQSDSPVVAFLARCDGQRSVAEHLAELKRAGAIPKAMTERAFARQLEPLIAAGFIEIEAFPLPLAGWSHTQVEEPDNA